MHYILVRCCLQGRSNGAVASSSAAVGTAAAAAAAAPPQRLGKLGKNPAVPTDFLPDVDREREEERMREQLKREYELREQACALLKASTGVYGSRSLEVHG